MFASEGIGEFLTRIFAKPQRWMLSGSRPSFILFKAQPPEWNHSIELLNSSDNSPDCVQVSV